ncbi:hypothetical protein [Caproicibacter sp.]|uniref:hypothetical protein n=1 Tax=Caproicibacter sp. TaxID=2814884 RepID=UPI00398A3FC7
MLKYKKSSGLLVLTWIMFFVLLGACISCAYTWKFNEFLVLLCIFEVPTIIAFPLVYQTIKIDNSKISLELWFIKLRTFLWPEVCEVGLAYTRAGYGTYKKLIYISKRPLTDKERFNLGRVKDHKNFITIENRGNIIDDIKKYSKLPFRDLPTTEDFNNM